MIALIDGDIVLFKAGFGAEKRLYTLLGDKEDITFESKKALDSYLKDNEITAHTYYTEQFVEPVENALHNAKSILARIKDNSGADAIKVYFTGKDNFRKALFPEYKANREKTYRPFHEQAIREYILKRKDTNAEITQGQEADDALGIAATKNPNNTVICSIDKDLNMIPGRHYNWDKETIYDVTEHDAILFFYMQLISGDSTDNIVGIPKMGRVRAAKELNMLETPEDMENAVAELYKRHYGDEWKDKMTLMGRLLWIRRQPEELWELSYV